MIGTLAVVSLPPLYVKPIIIVLLVCVTLFVVFKKLGRGEPHLLRVVGESFHIFVWPLLLVLGMPMMASIGPGTGTF